MATPTGTTARSDHHLWLAGSAMGRLVSDMDWSATALGPIDRWPESLRTTVNLCLASNFPVDIIWGPGHSQIYNDGYWPICGAKHPRSMGQDFRECWSEAWPVIGKAFDRALAGQATFIENSQIFLVRHGYLEETFFSFSFSPIRGETGNIAGLFHPVVEMTQATLASRRLSVLRDISDHASDAKSIREALTSIAAALEAHSPDVPFALLYQVENDREHVALAASVGVEPDATMAPARMRMAETAASWRLDDADRTKQVIEIDDLATRCPGLTCGPYPESPSTALVFPLLISGTTHATAFMIVGVSARRNLDEPYRNFYSMLCDSVTTAITNARAYEEERQRAARLAEIDRAKTVFFSNVSHEFRTPLTLMLGPLEDELRRTPGGNEGLQIAYRNALRLLKLVNSLLDFSRIEAGRIQANYEATDLADATAELASVFRSAIEKGGLRLTVECPPLPELVYVDRDMWEKIVLNLLSNAFKFTFEGEITVRLEGHGDHVALSVCDTGVGIAAAEQSRIFERFHRVRGARSRTHEGTGIGLALVHELARLHGGSVTVHSIEGQGSTLTVTVKTGTAHLPRELIGAPPATPSTGLGPAPFVEEALRWLPADESAASIAPAGRVLPQPLAQLRPPARIVWADDNADMREYVARLLSAHHHVRAVANGHQALAAVRAGGADLVLSDVMMPEMDGYALLRALRDDPATAEIPVILLSARAGEECRVEGMDAGADDYLIKPFSARELLARVEAHVRLGLLRAEARATLQRAHDLLGHRVAERTQELTDASGKLECELRDRRAAQAQVAGMFDRLVTVQQDERRRISGEIHDQLGQQMTALRLQLQALESRMTSSDLLLPAAHQANTLAEQVDQSIDTLAWNLRPTTLEKLGLLAAIENLVRSWSEQFQVTASFHAQRGLVLQLSAQVEISLYRIVQEALHNVHKHAGASSVTVMLARRKRQLVLLIEDDGCGFVVDPPGSMARSGMGLASMRERATAIEAEYDFQSRPGAGTSIYVRVPLEHRAGSTG